MSGGRLKNMSGAGAFITREALQNPNLNSNSIRCLSWIMTHAENFNVTVKDLLTRLPIGKDAWQTSRRQLIKEGYLIHNKWASDDGKYNHEYLAFREPRAAEDEMKEPKE